MKKALSFAVALGLVAGMASSAVASDMLTFHGTSRVRGKMIDLSQGTSDDKIQQYNMRHRFVIDANVSDKVTVKTRMTLLDSYLGDGKAASGGQLAFTGQNYLDILTLTSTDDSVTTNIATDSPVVDYAFIEVKDLLGATWSFGRMPASWTKFLSWGGHADRVKAMFPVGNGSLGVFLQKSTELNDPTADGDADAYSILYVGSAGDTKYRVIGVSSMDDTSGNDGLTIDANVKFKAGPMDMEVELAHKDNDAWADPQMGVLAQGSMALGDGLMGMFTAAYSKDGFTADDDYNPSNMIGNSSTAVMSFGDEAGAGDKAYIVAAGAKMKLDDASSLAFGLGFYNASDNNSMEMTEVDATYTRNIGKNTDLTVKAAYADVKDGDGVTAFGWKVSTAW